MRPLFAYLLIATVGLSAVRCATTRAPIYKQLEERKNRYEQLIEEVNGDFYEEPMRQVGWLLHNS